MSAVAALHRDVHALTPGNALIVAITPLAAFALGMIMVFPQNFWA